MWRDVRATAHALPARGRAGGAGVLCHCISPAAAQFREELEADVRVGSLIWVVENFFHWRDRDCHELGLCDAVGLAGAARRLYALERFAGGEPTPGDRPSRHAPSAPAASPAGRHGLQYARAPSCPGASVRIHL